METVKVENEIEQQQNAFAERVMQILNHGALSIMISLGHRSGLFDTLAKGSGTSHEIAERARLNERYVREWLNAMTVGQIVQYDPQAKRYELPEAHAALLTRQSPLANMAVFAQYIPVLGEVEEQVLDCFREGGGVPYSSYRRFHEVMMEDSGQTIVPVIDDLIRELMPEVSEKLEMGADVLDVGCGSGRALNALALRYPRSRFTGYDFSEEGITNGKREAAELNLKNVRFIVQDVAGMRDENKYDFVLALDAIHDQAKPQTVLNNIYRALRPDGTFLMQDIAGSSSVEKNLDHPLGPFIYTVSCMHCMSVSLSQKGDGLGTMWGRELAEQMVKKAGFGKVAVHQRPHDVQNYQYVIRK